MAILNKELNTRNISWQNFTQSVKLTSDILGLGYDVEGLKLLQEKTEKFGGIKNVLYSIMHDITVKEHEKKIQEFKRLINELIDEDKKVNREIEDHQAQIRLIQGHYNFARTLIDEYGIDPLSFNAIIETAKKYGEPMQIIQVINDHGSLHDLERKIIVNRGQLQELHDEINEMKEQREIQRNESDELIRRIGAIEERTKQNRALQNLSNLITNPANAQMNPSEFMLLAQSIFLGFNTYAKTHSSNVQKWNLYISKNLENTISRLNGIISESNAKPT